MLDSLVIAQTATRLWRRELATLFGVRDKWINALAGAILTGAVGFAWLLSRMLANLVPDVGTSPAVVAVEWRLIGAAVFVTAVMTVVIFCVLAPTRTALASVVEMLPVSRLAASIGMSSPMVAVGFLFAAVLTAPDIILLMSLANGVGYAIVTAVAYTVLVLTTQLVTSAMFQLVSAVCRRLLRLPAHHALGVAGAVCGGAGVAVVWHDVTSAATAGSAGGSGLTPYAAIDRIIRALTSGQGLPAWPTLAILVWSVGAVALFVLAAGTARVEPPATPLRTLAGINVPPSSFGARVWFDAVTLLRAPQFAVAGMLSIGGALALVALTGAEAGHPLATMAGQALITATGFVGMQSLGLTVRTRWLFRQLLARSASWIGSKAVACLLVSAVLAFSVAGILLVGNVVPATGASSMMLQVIPAWAAGLAAGSLVPYSEEQPLSTGVTAFVASLLYLSSVWIAGKALAGLGLTQTTTASALLAAAVLVAAYALTGRSLNTDDLRHG